MGRGFTTGLPSGELKREDGAMGVSTPPPNNTAQPPPVLLLILARTGSLDILATAALSLSCARRSCWREGGSVCTR